MENHLESLTEEGMRDYYKRQRKLEAKRTQDRLARERGTQDARVEASKPPEKIVEPKPEPKPSSIEQGLVASVGGGIYCLAPNGKKILVAKHGTTTHALCFANNNLYGGAFLGVYDALRNTDPIVKRQGYVMALCFDGAKLYDGGAEKKIFKNLSDDFISETSNTIYSLFYDKGTFLAGDNQGNILSAWTGGIAMKDYKGGEICGLALAYGKLYNIRSNKIFETANNNCIAERSANVFTLCFANGILYDGGRFGNIYDSLNDPQGKYPFWDFGNPSVYSITTVPMEFWYKIASRGKVVK